VITHYRPRILSALRELIGPLPASRVLDFGAGDGYFASELGKLPQIEQLVPVDVVARPRSLVVPQLYDGRRLPFEDRSFDLAYAVDVLHHCPDPVAAIDDMARCSGRYLLIKDHTFASAAGRWTLAILDELGNRRFGIPSPYLYQRGWHWVDHLEATGWRRLAFRHPLDCHSGPLGRMTNGLQWVGLWERAPA
jgi:SAM-dependent methyltransferase